jgi:hypothetical protein
VTPIDYSRVDIFNGVEAFKDHTSKYYYNKNTTKFNLKRQNELLQQDIDIYRELFKKLGLNYDADVPP